MSTHPRIGLACPRPGERAAFLEWCTAAGFEPVPMIDSDSIVRELESDGFEALVIDGDLAASGDTPYILRNLGRNRPLMVITEPHAPEIPESLRRVVSYLTRPVGRDEFVLGIALALAEGRPARRSPRRLVARLQATIEGIPARVVDVSYEGIRLELPDRFRTTLPPVFNVRVPMFDASVMAQRVWVNNALSRSDRLACWCGVRLGRNPIRATQAWQSLVDHAPASTAMSTEALNYL